MNAVRASRSEWRVMLDRAQAVARLALKDGAVLTGANAADIALALRDDLRGRALGRFPVDGVSAEDARLAFVQLGKAVLNAGLPRVRCRLALVLGVLAEELDGMIADQAAEETARSLTRAGAGD